VFGEKGKVSGDGGERKGRLPSMDTQAVVDGERNTPIRRKKKYEILKGGPLKRWGLQCSPGLGINRLVTRGRKREEKGTGPNKDCPMIPAWEKWDGIGVVWKKTA